MGAMYFVTVEWRMPKSEVLLSRADELGQPAQTSCLLSLKAQLSMGLSQGCPDQQCPQLRAGFDAVCMFLFQMSKTSASLGNLLNIKTEGDGSQAGAGEPTQYLGKAVKALVQEKLSEPWKMYLRR